MDENNDDLNHTTESVSADTHNVVYLIPLDAPFPLELQDARTESGPLLMRLIPLSEKELTHDVNVVALSGAELLALSRAWDYIVEQSNVVILTELPGARYDLIFDQARRQIGIRAVAWPLVESQLAESARTKQRTKDAQPWHDTTDLMAQADSSKPLPKAKGSNLSRVANSLAEPATDELSDYED
jgi:hypothetical protein